MMMMRMMIIMMMMMMMMTMMMMMKADGETNVFPIPKEKKAWPGLVLEMTIHPTR